jgi:ATP-binding cassette subfamily B protein RtxE
LIKNFVVDNFAAVCIDVLGMLTYGTVLAVLSPKLALLVFAFLPVSLTISFLTGRLMRAHAFAQREHHDRYHNHLIDAFRGFESVKYLSLVRPFTRWMSERLAPVVEHGLKSTLWGLKGSGGLEVVQGLATSLVLLLGGREVLNGHMTPGEYAPADE